mmetsp:Transcript_118398/g.287313  ORF Transcript_118398/g.287313 Transcript_118398/m.287313 type:complete len:111 (+) Transcript_118398:137-469(+)
MRCMTSGWVPTIRSEFPSTQATGSKSSHRILNPEPRGSTHAHANAGVPPEAVPGRTSPWRTAQSRKAALVCKPVHNQLEAGVVAASKLRSLVTVCGGVIKAPAMSYKVIS